MRNSIQYYYGIEVDDIIYENERYYFNDYILIPIYKEFNLNMYEYVSRLNLNNYEVVVNKDGKQVTNINDRSYILLKKKIKYFLNFLSLEKNTVPLKEKQIVPWDTLWENKIDYYEKHIRTLSSEKLKDTFHYYVGLGENAISIYKQIKKEGTVYLSHLRLTSNEDYLNPLYYVIDYRVRDVAEYVKKLFFDDRLLLNDIYLYISRNHFSAHECALFYVRLLYPSYYFDAYDLIARGECDDILNNYIRKINDYEKFLTEMYFYLKRFVDIPKIDWIVNKKDLSIDKSIFHPYL